MVFPALSFSPALLTPSIRRGRARQIVANAERFQRGEWKGLCELPCDSYVSFT
jgi:hypothetical protein